MQVAAAVLLLLLLLLLGPTEEGESRSFGATSGERGKRTVGREEGEWEGEERIEGQACASIAEMPEMWASAC